MESYQEINARTIDRWIEQGWEWGIPIDHQTFHRAKKGDWSMKLTPTRPVPREWFGDLKGKKVLGLAAGGGQQMPIFAACGAECTILDLSQRQIDSERLVAEREGYHITIVRADMTKRLFFEDEYFDIIFNPVSNDYVKEVEPIFKECYRVLKKGGIFMAGLTREIIYAVGDGGRTLENTLPFDPTTNEAYRKMLEEKDAGMQFSHSLEEQIGGQLRAGFTLTDLYEDTNSTGLLHDLNVKTYVATRAVK